MYSFSGPDDLMKTLHLMKDRADAAAADESNLKREQAWNRARSSAFGEVIEMLRDYFAERKAE